VRHRVAALLKKEVKKLQKEVIPSEAKRSRAMPPKLR